MTIEIKNLTVLPNLRYVNSDNKGRDFGVFMVKGAYDFTEKGECTLSSEQEPFNFTDVYYEELNTSALNMPSDLVGYKPKTDIILNVNAYSPSGKPEKEWLVGLRVQDENGVRLEKKLRILGPRFWVPKWKRELSEQEKMNWKDHMHLFDHWELTEPELIQYLPIRYEYAYGGMIHKGIDKQDTPIIEAYEHNPIGRGWIDREWTDHTKPVPAPQIENVDDPIVDPYKHYKPAGYGAIPPVWLPRRPLGGTFDQNWIDTVWPKWPKDYDFSYNNSAAECLNADLFLSEDIKIELVNLCSSRAKRTVKLKNPMPTISLGLGYEWDTVLLNLDTLYIDMEEQRVFCTWRTVFEQYKYESLIIRLAREHYHTRFPLFKNIFLKKLTPNDVALELNYE